MSANITTRVQYSGGLPVLSARGIPGAGNAYFVDTERGNNENTGDRLGRAFLTMAKALTVAQTGDTIYFTGKITEECVGDNLKFDITIVGLGNGLHHADLPATGYRTGASIWSPPASPTTATPLLKIRGRGWTIRNVMFDCPVDSAALYLDRNALTTTSEYDPSHLTVEDCRFVDGKYGIQDVGGSYHVTVKDCTFKGMTTCAITCTSTAVANPLNWRIINYQAASNVSSFGNASHIIGAFDCSVIRDGIFGTVTSTALYINLTGGNGNVVTKNTLAGNYATDDYVSGTGDIWYENYCKVTATTAPDGRSILVPAA